MAETHKGFGLLFEMGCGKTLTAIMIAGTAYQMGKVEKVLVVAPTSVCSVWPKDFAEFADFKANIKVLLGDKNRRLKLLNDLDNFPFKALKVAVINYESTWREGIFDALYEWNADMIICDESQRIKSHDAEQSKAMHKLGDQAKYKLILSGTPVQNNAIDLYSQYRFLDPTIFGTNFYQFEQNDLTELVDKLAIEPEAVDDDFNEDEALGRAEAEPVTKLGDVWLLGRHRLMCGDSTSQDDMAVLMNGEIADLVVTDPPYNVNYGDKAEMLDEYLPAKGHRNINHIKNDNMDNQSFYSFLLATYQSAYEFMRAGAAIYVFHAESTGHIFRQAFLDAGLKLAQCLIWEKNAFVLGRQDYQWRHEPCLYGWKEGAAHYFINDRTQDTVILEDDIDFSAMKKNELVAYLEELRRKNRDQTSVIYENKPTRNDIHPTMKPIALVGKFITNSSKSGWNVLDLFGGSGSTLMAAEQLGRTAFIMELDERFCDVIVKRWEDYTGQQAVRIPAEDVK